MAKTFIQGAHKLHKLVTLPNGRTRRCICGNWFPADMGTADARQAHAAHLDTETS
jgi:hypothetical protein